MGSVVATRLVENLDRSVIVLEAGKGYPAIDSLPNEIMGAVGRLEAPRRIRYCLRLSPCSPTIEFKAEVAQLVEQWTENPCVGSSNLPLGTTLPSSCRTPPKFVLPDSDPVPALPSSYRGHPVPALPSSYRGHPVPTLPSSYRGHPVPALPSSYRGHPVPTLPSSYLGHPVPALPPSYRGHPVPTGRGTGAAPARSSPANNPVFSLAQPPGKGPVTHARF